MPVPYDRVLHIPSIILLLLAARQEQYRKSLSLLTKIIEEFSGGKKVWRNGSADRKR